MGNINYDDILSRLSRIRQDNLRRQDNRKAEVYARIPRIKEIDDAIAHSAVQASRARILHQKVDEEALSMRSTSSWHRPDTLTIIWHRYTTALQAETAGMWTVSHVHV